MKTLNIIIFFAIFFTIYGLVNYYIFIRGWQATPPEAPWRGVYIPLFLFLSLSFIVGRFLERAWISPLSSFLVWIGSFWFAAMAYFFLSVVILDLLRLGNLLVPFFPDWVTHDYTRTKEVTAIVVTGIVLAAVAGGAVNALFPEVRELTIRLPKKMLGGSTLHIVAASDIHLGTIIGNHRFERIVRKINALDPDVVLLPGDIVDEDLGPVIRQNLGENLKGVASRYGTFAITGNHEYIGGVEEACRYLADHGVTVLRDSVATLPNGVQIVGREDRSIGQFSGKGRKPLGELMEKVQRKSPILLLDHQPFKLEEAEQYGVDVQLSGHTHHGQLWPFNLITGAIYEVSWGYVRKGSAHIYVSSGVGTWGPPVRTGNRPEMVSLRLVCDG